MIRLPLKTIPIKDRPAGYEADAMRLSTIEGDFAVFTPDDYLTLIRKYSPQRLQKTIDIINQQPNKIKPFPKSQWPIWAKSLALLAIKTDKGLGDTIERLIGPIGGDAFKEWYKNTTGKDCGCNDRKEVLNIHYMLT